MSDTSRVLLFSVFLLGCSTASVQQTPVASLAAGTCQDGVTRRGFLTPTTGGDVACVEGVQTCVSGQWQGPILHDSCQNFTKSCQGAPHGSVMTGYAQPTSPKGMPCLPATKTCLNGTWTGPEVFPSCNEL